MNRVRLLLLNAALGPLDYKVPDGMAVEYGSVVVAPLGPRKVVGIVWEPDHFDVEDAPAEKLRPLFEVLDVPPLEAELRRLIEWTSDYYLASMAAVARMALSSSAALKGALTISEYRLTGERPVRMTPQRQSVFDALGGEQATVRELAEMAGVSDGVIRGLVNAGLMEAVSVSVDRPYPLPVPDFAPPNLSDAQEEVAAVLRQAVIKQEFAPFLLDGVTGSGKTEVYFEAVASALKCGHQVLVLLPEIALTQPFLKRFEGRFGAAPTAWHSGLKQAERRRAWRAVAKGRARVVVGARSSLFLPYENLGLIIVDEAHETSFKQEEGVRYNARDVAVMRAQFESFPVILASATPAIESRHMAEMGRYKALELPSRFGGATMPDLIAIDLTQDPPERGKWIAPPLLTAIQERWTRTSSRCCSSTGAALPR